MNRYSNGAPNQQQQQQQQHQMGSGPNYGVRQQRDEPLSKTNIFIRGLATNTNDQDLYNMCNKFGPIVSSKSITDRMTNECKGYGFVNFENQVDAANAVRELSTCGYQARMSKENIARSDRSFGRRSPLEYRRSNGGNPRYGNNGVDARPFSKTNLYLRGLDVNTSDVDLHNLCTRYGTILSAKAIIDRATNECKGYGFVNFDSEYSAEQAIVDLSSKGYQVSMSRENRNNGMAREPIMADGPPDSWQ